MGRDLCCVAAAERAPSDRGSLGWLLPLALEKMAFGRHQGAALRLAGAPHPMRFPKPPGGLQEAAVWTEGTGHCH